MNHPRHLCCALTLALTAAATSLGQLVPQPASLPGLAYDQPFFPGAAYDGNVPTPDSVLGFAVGSRPANHAQIEAVIKAIAEKSPRCRLFEYGRTFEGRTLYYLVIASEANIQRLDAIKTDLARLADPRTTSAADADRLAESLPAVAWMAYVIHGDEMSGSDAALAVAYHLAAGTDADVTQLLSQTIVIIDPLMNPDGRDRFLSMLAQNRTATPSVDDQSLMHTGFWPSGRMNHYLFDMNRDWIFGTQPETRGRLAAVNQWHPHYFMESHEMGSQDTFLFMPGREALNPNLPENIRKWETRFAQDQAAAFDARGWRYYTGEWNDNWYPGYSSSWAALRGSVENLYEQAAIATDAVRRPEGLLEAYREAVHKQLVSSMANLNFLAKNRREILADYVLEKRKCVAADAPHAGRTFAIVPSANGTRKRRFLDLMAQQGFEVLTAEAPFKASGVDRLGREVKEREFPAGTLLIPNRQPLARLLSAMLEFDPRMKQEFLTDERRELLRFGRTRIYDITGWALPMLFDVEAFELSADPRAEARAKPTGAMPAAAPVTGADASVAFVIDGTDDASVAAAGRLMDRGIWCRAADKPFQFDGREFARGSILVIRKDNPDNGAGAARLGQVVSEECARLGLTAVGVKTGMGPGDLPDLGGEHFVLLHTPRIAILGRDPASPYSYGQVWYQIDQSLGLRASYLDLRSFGGADLRRYNVLIVPEGAGPAIADRMDAIKQWVSDGGTLIALGSSSATFAKEKGGLGSTRLVTEVLTKLDDYRQAVVREWEGRRSVPEPAAVWAFAPPSEIIYPWLIGESGEKPSEDEAKRRDAWRDLFMPAGALLAARIDDRSWLTGGCGEYVPVIFSGSTVLLSPPSVQTPARFGVFSPAPPKPPEPPKSDAKPDEKKEDKKDDKKPAPGWSVAPPGQEMRLRMSGLLWPEAADRLANSAFVTREGIGSGQIILFASDPNFRAASLGTIRIFSNAVVLGPGMGATQPIKP